MGFVLDMIARHSLLGCRDGPPAWWKEAKVGRFKLLPEKGELVPRTGALRIRLMPVSPGRDDSADY